MSKILITGNKGYMGKRIFRSMEAIGHDVQGFDVQAQGFEDDENQPVWTSQYNEEVSDKKFDVIIHAGAIAQVHYSDPDIFFWNTETTRILCEKAGYDGSRFVYFSSCAAIQPHTYYGWSKRLSEFFIPDRCDNYCIVRPFNVFGTDVSRRTPWSIADKIVGNNLEYVYYPYVRDFIHVDDIVDTIVATASSDVVGSFNLGTGKGYSTIDLVEAWGQPINAKKIPLPPHITPEIIASAPIHPQLKITHDVLEWLQNESHKSQES